MLAVDWMNQAQVQFRREPIVEADPTPDRTPIIPYLAKGVAGPQKLVSAFDIITHSHSTGNPPVIKSTQREPYCLLLPLKLKLSDQRDALCDINLFDKYTGLSWLHQLTNKPFCD